LKKQSPKIINAKLASIWSKEKLRNIAPLRGGFAFKSEKFQNTGIPIVRISNIKFDGTVGGEFEYYSKIIPDEKFVLRGRSILLAMSGATTGKIAMLDSEEEYYQNQRVGYFQNTGEVDYDFLSSVLQTKAFTNQLNAVLVAGAQPNISSKEIDSFEFCIPDSIDEQSAIGSLFRTLDDLLASYKDNLANYQSLKATMLSKMFPKTGQKVPEIRLDGFEGEWEVQSLKELASFSKGNGYTKSDLVNSGNEIILYGQLYTNYQTVISRVNTFVLETREKSVISKGGEVVVPASGESAGDISRASVIEKSGVIIGGDLNIIYPNENKVDSIFLALTISNGSQQKELIKRAQGKSVVHLRNNDLEKVVLHYPSMEEQRAIGLYFSNLDNLINSHQEKISQLETLKKKLLQDMFI
jgi:type I restriction modification DNA specificity domain protein